MEQSTRLIQSLRSILLGWCVLFGATIPLHYHLFPTLFDVDSDSIQMLWVAFLALLISFAGAIGFRKTQISPWLHTIVSYYCALVFIKYGFDKLTLGQFYTPEPNILYTPLGQLPKEMLFWSTMGFSPLYNYVLGGTEIAIALLLLFRKTRFLGAILGLFVMLYIVLVNISFDVSVQYFALFLLIAFALIGAPVFKSLYHFFAGKLAQLPALPALPMHTSARVGLKTFVISLFAIEALYPQLNGQSFDDRKTARPFLHGAYAVLQPNPIKKCFVHRDGYLILQLQNDEMLDYGMLTDTVTHAIQLRDYNRSKYTIQYQFQADTLQLTGQINDRQINIKATKIDLSALPVFR